MKKIDKINQFILFSLLFILASTFFVSAQDLKPDYIVWGSASLGSRGYITMEAFCSTLNKLTDLKNSSISTAGGAENLALIGRDEIQFGQGMRLDLYNAYHGVEPYKEKIDFVQVLSYGISNLPVASLADSDIKTMEDLRGKKIAVGPANGGAVPIAKAVLNAYGLLDDVQLVYQGWSEAPDALMVGQVDASFIWVSSGFNPHSGFQKLALTHELRILEMDEAILAKIAEENEGFTIGTVQQRAFSFLTKDYISPGSSSILVADPDLDEDLIYEIVKTLYDNEETVRSIDELNLVEFTIDGAVKDAIHSYPFHPGAARYFKEVGIWSDDLIVYEYK